MENCCVRNCTRTNLIFSPQIFQLHPSPKNECNFDMTEGVTILASKDLKLVARKTSKSGSVTEIPLSAESVIVFDKEGNEACNQSRQSDPEVKETSQKGARVLSERVLTATEVNMRTVHLFGLTFELIPRYDSRTKTKGKLRERLRKLESEFKADQKISSAADSTSSEGSSPPGSSESSDASTSDPRNLQGIGNAGYLFQKVKEMDDYYALRESLYRDSSTLGITLAVTTFEVSEKWYFAIPRLNDVTKAICRNCNLNDKPSTIIVSELKY
jgi:hypothetical protein